MNIKKWLRELPKCRNDEINNFQIQIGLERSDNDTCLYAMNLAIEKQYSILYVDFILAGKETI